VLILDLRRHDETWTRSRLGHIHLGFTAAELRKFLKDAGFERVHVRHGDGKRDEPFKVLIATGRVPKSGKR
jgi:ArsR family transcriptional regulator